MSKVGFTEQGRRVSAHWARLAVTYEGALDALRAQGLDVERLRVEDLHQLDMLHMGGLAATDRLAVEARVAPGERVLDVGSGVGGPARRLASRFGASVCGLELSETLCDTARRLTEHVGMSENVSFENASALALPFDDQAFDVVVMQHVAMQISEKDTLFSELARVTRPAGRLALHEIFSGPGELQYPLAWATEPSMSALESFETCADRLSGCGFEVGAFQDQSEEGRRFHEQQIAAFREALDQASGTQGLAVDAVQARLRASVAMKANLRRGSLRVGMVVNTRLAP